MAPTTKKILKWSILAVLLAYVIGITFWVRMEARRHLIKGITITMVSGKGLSDTITVRGIKASLKNYPGKIVGVPANIVNTLAIEKYLMNINNFEDVKCFVSSNGFLKIDISPMIPELRVFDGDRSYYVNKAGKRINSNADFYADVPIVSGHFTKSFRPEMILPVVRYVKADEELNSIVGMFEARGPRDILLIPKISGHVINFGDTTRLDEKRKAILTAYHKIIPYKGWEEYDTISVKFRGQIIATRRNKAPLYPIEVYEEEIDPEEGALPTDSVREVKYPGEPKKKQQNPA